MKKLFGILCITSLFLSGCFREKTYHDNGNLKSIGSLKDGKWEGEWKTYYDNGELTKIGSYKDGKKDGEWKSYHENGELAETGLYDVDLKEGKWKIYNKHGQFDMIEHWEYGELIKEEKVK